MDFEQLRESLKVPAQEIVESFNDDDYYLVNKKTKKVIKNLGKVQVAFGTDPKKNPTIKAALTSPNYDVVKGMAAKHLHYVTEDLNENDDHAALLRVAQAGHLRALKKGNGTLAKHYARRMAFHTRHIK